MTQLPKVHQITQPLTIGDIVVDPPLALAPMAGHTHYAFRAVCREQGDCGLVSTELVSSNILHNEIKNPRRTTDRFDWRADEKPFQVQLYGHDPAIIAEAAQLVVEHGAGIVDINMGCWVPKVARTGGGAALLRDIKRATAVVDAVVKAVSVPVTVKVRAGWDAGNITAVDFARAAEDVGAQLVTVHARTAKQGFRGEADWSIIRRVKEVVNSIPIIGNGDVNSPEDAARMFEQTGCDGIMIGRAALGRPWLFRQIAHYLRTGQHLPEPSRAEQAAIVMRHALLFEQHHYYHEYQVPLELRGQLARYCANNSELHSMRQQLVRINAVSEVNDILQPVIGELV